MLDVEKFISAVKVNWIMWYCTPSNQGDWKITFNYYLIKIGDENFFNSALNEKHLKLYVTVCYAKYRLL